MRNKNKIAEWKLAVLMKAKGKEKTREGERNVTKKKLLLN